MIVTTLGVKRLKPGTKVELVKDGRRDGRIRGHIVASGPKKVFVSESGTIYDIKDRPGWHWERDPEDTDNPKTRKSRELPVTHAKSGRRKDDKAET